MKSLCPLFPPESPSRWGVVFVLLLVFSGPAMPQEGENSPSDTVEAQDSSPTLSEGREDETGSEESKPESEEAETAGVEGGPEEDSFLRPTEESEVLEERRAGAEKVEDALPQELKKTGLYWDLGPHYEALDGNLRLVFGSRLHLDAAYYDESSAMEEIGESDDDTEVRRAFAHMAGVLFRQFEFKLQVNFANQFDRVLTPRGEPQGRGT